MSEAMIECEGLTKRAFVIPSDVEESLTFNLSNLKTTMRALLTLLHCVSLRSG